MSSQEIQIKNDFDEWLGNYITQLEEMNDLLDQESLFQKRLSVLAKAVAHNRIEDSKKGKFVRASNSLLDMNKTEIKNQVKREIDKVEDELAEDDPLRWKLDALVMEVDTVIKRESTDSVFTPKYVWEWSVADNEFRVETEGQHKNWYDFQELLMDASHDLVINNPSEDYDDMSDWKEFIQEQINEKKETRKDVGPRTEVIEQIRRTIERQIAQPSVEEAVKLTELAYDEDEDKIWISSSKVNSIAEEYSITRSAVRDELEARGIVTGKVSHLFELEDGFERYWELPGDFAEVKLPNEETDSQTEGGLL